MALSFIVKLESQLVIDVGLRNEWWISVFVPKVEAFIKKLPLTTYIECLSKSRIFLQASYSRFAKQVANFLTFFRDLLLAI